MQIIINMTKEMQIGMKGGDMQKHQVLLIFVIIIFRHDVLRSPPGLSKKRLRHFLHQVMYVWIYHDLSIHSMYIFNDSSTSSINLGLPFWTQEQTPRVPKWIGNHDLSVSKIKLSASMFFPSQEVMIDFIL